ncbi:MAG: hypothetical protein RL571_2669 [Pseudomonadota bacterium]|jgi:PPP family 3-phenylpropionic acid transporter
MLNLAPLLAIACFYFAYFAFNGLFSPYWGLYLASLSFPAWQIGILTSLTQVNRIYAPTLWGWLADRRGSRQGILRIAGIAGLIFFIPLLFVHAFWPLFFTVLIASFFWSASLPLVEATAMTLLSGDGGAYARLRIWGSVGFIVATVIAGYLMQHQGVATFPWAVVAVMVSLALFSWQVPEASVAQKNISISEKLMDVLKKSEVQVLLLSCFLMALAHGPYYSFYSIYAAEYGHDKSTIGWFWTIGVMAEVGAFWLMPKLTRRFSLKNLFLFGLAMAVLRFMAIAWGMGSLALLVLAQLAHAFTFGSHHAVTMAYIHRYFTGSNQTRGQALYIAASFGLGGSLGGILAGLLWVPLGGQWVFSLAALIAAAAWFLARRGLNSTPTIQA